MAIGLGSLNGVNGFEVRGEFAGGQAGWSIAGGGDFNGDGFEDFLIGAPYAGASNGVVHVVYGAASGFGSAFNLSALNGANGFQINGAAGAGLAGSSVSFAGDLNDDGFSDIVIGAPAANAAGAGSGAAYVIFGGSANFGAAIDVSALNGTTGFRITGAAVSDALGGSVSSAGDINGDGVDDLIVGARYANGPGGIDAGATYVVFGKTTAFTSNLQASALNGSNGFAITGGAAGDFSGYSVSSAGDINGDNIDDLLIGAPGAGAEGSAYVVFGKSTAFSASLDLTTLNGSNGFRIAGAASGDLAGYSAASIGDINGDGLDDIVIGATAADPGGVSSAGRAYVIFGKTGGFAATLSLSSLNGSNGFVVSGGAQQDELGISVAGAGDVNNDGYDDLIVGAFLANPGGAVDAGQAYLVYGSKYGFAADINVAALKSWQGFALNGVAAGDAAGASVGGADINDDGFDDLLVGATRTDPAGLNSAGSAYVVFGAAGLGAGAATNGDDFLVGGAGSDNLAGLAGADLIRGLGIGDTLSGGDGADTLEGGDGSDRILGGAGVDTVDTGAGNDSVDAGDDADLVLGQNGRDSILGGDGNDTIDGGIGNDTLLGSTGHDVITGGSGKDTIDGANGNDALTGGVLGDSIVGGGNNDSISGGDGGDILRGGTDNDRIIAEGGRDSAYGEDGDDAIDMGSGDDFADGGLGRDGIYGGNGADSIVGLGGNDTLQGGSENDTLLGQQAFDVLIGGDGADSLDGGGSDDILFGEAGNDVFVFSIGGAQDTLRDFSAGAAVGDVVRLTGFGSAFDTFAEVLAAATDNGISTTIDFGNGDVIILQNVTVAQLNANDFTFG